MHSVRISIALIGFVVSLAPAPALADPGHDVGTPQELTSAEGYTVGSLPTYVVDVTPKPQAEPLDEGGCRWDVNDIRRQQADTPPGQLQSGAPDPLLGS